MLLNVALRANFFFFLFTVGNCSFFLLVAFRASDFPALMSWQFSFLGIKETIQNYVNKEINK